MGAMMELTPRQIAGFRSQVEAELAEISELSDGGAGDRAPVRLDQQSVGRVSRADAMRVQAMAVASEQRRTARIAALRSALERIQSGEFGICVGCDEMIAAGRLAADPATPVCVSCAGAKGG